MSCSLIAASERGLSEAHITRAELVATMFLINHNLEVVVACHHRGLSSRIPEVAAEIVIITLFVVVPTVVSLLGLFAILWDRVTFSI